MWWWVMIWFLLLLVAGLYLGVRLWGLWGQTKELGSELLIAQRHLDEVQAKLDLIGEATGSPEELAVFADPAVMTEKRERTRANGRRARQERGALSRPAWAKHVD
jgi:hypothetical protein